MNLKKSSSMSTDHFRSYKINYTKSNEILNRLRNASILCVFFLIIEIIGGILSKSLAILSDAAHLFADLTSFMIAILAARLAQVPPNAQNTFGYQRAEALAALFSMSSLLVLSLFLGLEAIQRGILFWSENFHDSKMVGMEVNGRIMSLTAFVGVLVNLALMVVLGVENHVHLPGDHHDHSHEHGHDHNENDHRTETAKSRSRQQDESDNHNHHDHHHDHIHPTSHGNANAGFNICEIYTDSTPHIHNKDASHSSQLENGHDHSHTHSHAFAHFDPDKFMKKHKTDEESHPLLCSQESYTDSTTCYGTAFSTEVPKNTNHIHSAISSQDDRNLNLHAAYMHVLADLAQSVSVFLAGLVIWYQPKWKWVDPVSTLIFCILVIRSTIKIILASVSVLMNQVPADMDWLTVHNRINQVQGISDVHNLHVWSVSHGERAMSVHARAENIPDGLKAIRLICKELGIQHSAIQLQPVDIDPCVTCEDECSVVL